MFALSTTSLQSIPDRDAKEITGTFHPDIELVLNEVEAKMLPTKFGHKTFRAGQRDVIGRVLSGNCCLAVLPTGAGKSLLYMLPSQLLDGMTLVVSPLLALMRDQVEILTNQGIAATRLDSSMSFYEISEAFQAIKANKVKVLFVSPERFNNESFLELLPTMKVAMFVVDEAHCISEWGHSFRPDYLRVSHFAALSGAKVRLALTATATKRVVKDILEKLDIPIDSLCQLPSIRRNLILSVKLMPYPNDDYNNRLVQLLQILDKYSTTGTGAAIVYVGRQKLSERLANDLTELYQLNAKAYHAGMDPEERTKVERWFLSPTTLDSECTSFPIVVG